MRIEAWLAIMAALSRLRRASADHSKNDISDSRPARSIPASERQAVCICAGQESDGELTNLLSAAGTYTFRKCAILCLSCRFDRSFRLPTSKHTLIQQALPSASCR